jgi:hypothetical protein
LYDVNLFYRARDRGRDLDYGFVGFEFHHGLAFGDAGAGGDHQPDEFPLVDVFTELR